MNLAELSVKIIELDRIGKVFPFFGDRELLMKLNNIGGCRNINEFVSSKLEKFNKMPHDFASLFELMFSESENIMYERSVGFRIIKTTYGEAKNSALAKASVLCKKLNAQPNSVVGIHMENSLAWIETFWAVLKCGFRPLLLNLRLDTDTLERALGDASAVAVISDSNGFSKQTILASELEGGDASDAPNGQFGGELLVMSSGTTGQLKLCGYSAEELYWQILDSAEIVKSCRQVKEHYDGELKLLTFLPFYHIFGLFAMYIWFAFFSRCFVQLNDLSSQTVQNTIRRHKVTHIFAVPLFWETVYDKAIRTVKSRGDKTYAKLKRGFLLCRRLERHPSLYGVFTKKAFSEVRDNLFGDSVQFMITGGSDIKPDVLSFFNDIGYHLVNGYGMTELGITSVELSTNPYERNQGHVGRPLSSVEYKLDENGQLLVRGRSIAKYIIENGQITYNDGKTYFATNDLAAEENGHYRILGRRDDMIVLPDGENLNPSIVEPKLASDGIQLCIVASNETATLVISPGGYRSADQIQALEEGFRERIVALGLGSQIKRIVFTPEKLIPDNEFKVNRGRIKKALNDGRLTLMTSESLRQRESAEGTELENRVRELFAVALGKEAKLVGFDSDFFTDEGGSSLEYFTLLAALQEEFSIPMPTESGHSLSTVKTISAFIEVQNGLQG